jgi:hypothetical protein
VKKVILFIIDSLHPVVLGRLLSEGNAPALRFLAHRGKYWEHVVSSFPTMTPVATSSIMTGHWPDRHLVPGFIWYNSKIGRIVDYGATWQSVLKVGPEKIVRNLLQKLNQEHLSPYIPTMHETLEDNGFDTGSINFFIHRSSHPYLAKVPALISLASRFQIYREKVMGPRFLTLGELIHPPFSESRFAYPGGALHRYGFNDTFSGKVATQMIKEGKQPDFLVVYLPDNDKYSHDYGPLRSGPAIEHADEQIAAVLDALGSWDKAIEENIIIVTGDHSQTTVGLGDDYLINLDKSLSEFKQLKQTEFFDENKDVAICPNERMAFVYILRNKLQILPEVVGILSKDERNAQVAWRARKNAYCVIQGGTEKKLMFSRRGPYQDVYGQTWKFDGDLSVVDARITPENTIEFGNYPDAFSRLISALEGRKGSRVVVSAKSGYEYFGEGAPIHPGGGSHGSLEREDSTVPMIIAGATPEIEHPRIIDLFSMILKIFQIELPKGKGWR